MNRSQKNLILIFSLTVCFLPFIFSGCKSTPQEQKLPEVEPLALLDEDSSIYVYVPVNCHKQLVQDILTEVMPSVTDSQAKLITKQIESLYAGLATVKDRSRLQLSCSGDFPDAAVNAVFTKKNGWIKSGYIAASSEEALELFYPNEFSVYSRKDMDYSLSFCSDKVLSCAGKIEPMLEQYAVRAEIPDTEYAAWLDQETEDILVYITRPGQYLRNLIGTVIAGCQSVYGTLKYKPDAKNSEKYSGSYILSLNIELSNPKFMKPWIGALNLALAMLDGKAVQKDDSTIFVDGIEITEKQIKELFTLDPVTGKHFRVSGDTIITE